ncbi:MAG: L,D-transpeptidase [Polyangiaceae bacterium]|nr:L,D-transpeptidase [Polyangiaceae bacterium]MCW5790230.1 L,D-transpeptidase [Polyangiaceae bacterium]
MLRAVAFGSLLVLTACGAEPGAHHALTPASAPGERSDADAEGTERAATHSSGELIEPEPADPFGPGYPGPLPEAGEHGRVGSLTWGSWIHPKPDSRSLPLGGIRIGDSVEALGAPVRSGLGRCQSYVPVLNGYACTDRRNTMDMSHPFIVASRYTEPAKGPFPYHYAFSLGAPMLTRVPTPEENRWRTGPREHRKLRGWEVGHDELTEQAPIEPNGPIPEFLRDGGHAPSPWGNKPHLYFKQVPFGSMIAYTRAFEAHGEVWVLSTNLTVVPAKGLLRFRRSTFQGVELGKDVQLPIAWMRKRPRPKYQLQGDRLVDTGETWPLRSWVALTGQERRQDGARYLETTTPGVYIASADANLAERRAEVPREARRAPGERWVHVRVNRGTLTLYEGDRPVFTTLMSPGKDGATPYGRYWVESKSQVSTMTTEMGEPRKFWIADVPWTQYFKRPYAMHASYWHEDFGETKSGGCVNLSPIDAERVFRFTAPEAEPTWGTTQAYGMGGGTFVLVEG